MKLIGFHCNIQCTLEAVNEWKIIVCVILMFRNLVYIEGIMFENDYKI